MSVIIRAATAADAGAIAAIYRPYVTETTVTFEEEAPDAAEIAWRMAAIQDKELPYLVAEDGGMLGYAYASPFRPRSAYRFTAEVTVYVARGAGRQGVGTALYGALFSALETRGVHVALGVIALPNEASVALHEKFGMKKVAHLQQVGQKFGRWIDVGYWQRVL